MARYIDAERLLKVIEYWISNTNIKQKEHFAYKAVEALIEEQPTADVVEVVHGCWLSVDEYGQKIGIDTEGYLNNWVFCSNCEQQMRFAGWLYCPNCGAKMGGKKVEG